jgi:5-methylcytosine-specific restriction protein A
VSCLSATQRKRKRTPHQPVGRWIRKERRQAIYERDGFACLICERPLLEVSPSERTLDHLVPLALGGSNASENLFTACRSCNSSRRASPDLSKFSTEVQQRVLSQTRVSLPRKGKPTCQST